MKQSNSALIYIVKEHRHVLLYFYTHHLAHIDYKIRRIALSNCYPGCCMLLNVCFCYTLYYLIYDPYLDIHGTIEQYRATLVHWAFKIILFKNTNT